ncbi:MAG: hypothetical protein COW63_16755 [Bacteroidetes bacterium CG18_big_fil_WC_8_21_14_2_50_41_14]|nr:MAG: hypothetical protein COW63_16755 [Bacteroidetes bacterium CG18_big_fil_WC_8_21_14_2_50_41_14]PJB54975.1 MAG: hypothetical protein CO098_18775 [Bacteroidetes bacterium CG_4_9_14_3_um_filter_41_19]
MFSIDAIRYTFAPSLITIKKIEIMKKLVSISFVLVAMLASMVGYSNEYVFITNNPSDKVTELTFEKVEKGSTLTLKDKQDEVLYTETMEQTGSYSKGFDLTILPDGVYYFELDTREAIKVLPVQVMGTTVKFVKEGERNISKPKVMVRDAVVYLSKESMDHKSVKIEVYYEGQDLAYSERIKKGQKVNRVYDFSSSRKGNYVIVMRSEGRTFTNKVLI